MPSKESKEDDLLDNLADTLSLAELLDDEQDRDNAAVVEKKVQQYKHLKYIRMAVLFILWLTSTALLFATKEVTGQWFGTVIPVAGKIYALRVQPEADKLTLRMRAPFQEQSDDIVEGKYRGKSMEHLADTIGSKLIVVIERDNEKASESMEYALINPDSFNDLKVTHLYREYIFTLKPSAADKRKADVYSINFSLVDSDKPLPLQLQTFPAATKTPMTAVWAALVLLAMFVIFFWDAVSRGIVTMLFSTLTIGLLGFYFHRLQLKEVLNYVDFDTILLIFGLTIIICVVADTGGDHYLAVQCYRLSNGHIWPMLTVMLLATALGAAFLNPTMILMLITSLAIRLCEILQLNPTSVLTCLILFSNTGSMLTRSGSPEDSILSLRGVIEKNHIFKGYGIYLLQMLLPVLVSMSLTYMFLRFYYRSSAKMRIIEPPIVSRLRNAIRFWSRAAQGMSGYTKDETVLRDNMLSKVDRLRQRLRRLGKMPVPADNFEDHLKLLQERHQVHEVSLLIMCCIVLSAVVIMQIAHSFRAHQLSPGWICMLFALVLLALASWKEFEVLMAKIDWSTLVTIACLFIIMRGLKPLGLMEAIGNATKHMISGISKRYRMNVASILVLIVTTFCTAFTDADHAAYVMANKALLMNRADDLDLHIEPLLLAVFMGAGFGANATLISSISNIVCAGIAEKHGFQFYFWDFFKVGFLVTLLNILMGIIYLLIFNAVFGYE